MKRILLAVCILALFAGCGGKPVPEAVSEPESSQEEISVEEEAPPLTVALTIPEGFTLARIGLLLEELEVCSVEEFVSAAQEGDYTDFPLVAAQREDERRCFALEGYLFPDTYEIYFSEPPESIIRRILAHTEQRVDEELRERIRESGYTIDEVLTMASIIEKEALGEDVMPLISSVIHNRIEIGMRLQCDVTIAYVEGAIKPFITGDLDYYNDFYNTYKCYGLPAGAICNPGLPAIRAALAPAESDYLFFVTDQEQNFLFAETWEEHLDNLDAAGINPA